MALFIRSNDIADRAPSLIWIGVATMVLMIGAVGSIRLGVPALGGGIGLLLLGLVLFAVLRYVRLLHDLRQAILT